MSFNNNSTTDLSRYSIGEIVDLSGVANFYNAGSSKWLKSGTYVAGSLLSTTTKATLAASQTSATSVALATTNDVSLNQFRPVLRETWQEAKVDSISTTVLATRYPASAVNVIALTSAGAQPITVIGSTHLAGNSSTTYSLVSNNSKFFVYYFTNTTTMGCKSSTDGINWTTETLTNMPTISGIDSNTSFWDSTTDNYFINHFGFAYQQPDNTTYGSHAVLWCGARFLLITKGTSTFRVASLSTNGVAWSSSTDTAAILGSASITFLGSQINFYRNGNTCYLAVGTNYRSSTDGGITWAAATGTNVDPASAYNLPNATDPTKRIINGGSGSTSAYYTSNSGQSWSSSRTLPQSDRWSLAYRGSTVTSSYVDGSYRSVDDGVTWTPIIFPAGTNSSGGQIFADAYRFYFVPNAQPQILTSTDAITWTITTTPGNINAAGGSNFFSVSSNVAYLSTGSMSQGVFTLDGGVTWAFAQAGTSTLGGNINGFTTTPTTYGGVGGYLVQGFGNNSTGNYFLLSVAALNAGGGFYRTGSSAITPVRTGAFSYVRVG
jgi:hypothetical protein